MMETDKYLSDEELDRLINDVESEDLIAAPAQIQSEVLKAIEKENSASHHKNKVVELYRYSAKVVFAIAAALLLLFITPGITGSQDRIPTREEVISQNRIGVQIVTDGITADGSSHVASREEVIEKRRKDHLIVNVENFIFEMGGKLR